MAIVKTTAARAYWRAFVDKVIGPVVVRSASSYGISQPRTGRGSASDHSIGYRWHPRRLLSPSEIDAITDQSWVAEKIVQLPAKEIATRWRIYDARLEELDTIQTLRKEEKAWRVISQVTDCYAAARKYGTAYLCIVTGEAPLDTPLNMQAVRKDDLKNLLILSPDHVTVLDTQRDVLQPRYGEPLLYTVATEGNVFPMHGSRVIRMDAKPRALRATNKYGWSGRAWQGQSFIQAAFSAINHDDIASAGVAHLLGESSMLVLKVEGMKQSMGQNWENLPDEENPKKLAEKIGELRSIYRMTVIDTEDTMERVNVNFTGLPQVMQQYMLRIAGAAEIPATVFWGMSPAGMNATGKSDLENMERMLSNIQRRIIDPALRRIDPILAANVGVNLARVRMPSWSWPSICLLYTSPSPRDRTRSRMPSSA